MITADTITDEQIRSCWTEFHNAITKRELMAALREPVRDGHNWDDADVMAARARCAELLNARAHTTTIETEIRGVQVGNTENHLYHRWSCSCGAVGSWGHALWAKVSVACVEVSAKQHVLEAIGQEAE